MIDRNTIITTLTVFAMTLFLIFLFLVNQKKSLSEIQHLKTEQEAWQKKADSLQKILSHYTAWEKQQAQAIRNTAFDALDKDNFRLYALYKDVDSKYSPRTLANDFNIENETAIKSTKIREQTWFVVPVKGVHFFQKGQTLGEVAKRYYQNDFDSVLIQRFNKNIQPNSFIALPHQTPN
jgi:hypothetical protein